MNKKKIEKISSGIKGFDKLINGGFVRGQNIIISGTPGTGKTTFSLQFLIDGALKGEQGIYLSLSEDIEKLLNNYSNFEWELEKLIKQKKLFFTIYPREFVQQIGEAAARVSRLVNQIEHFLKKGKNIKRVVIDSVSLLGYRFKDIQAKRNELDYLFQYLSKKNITALFTLERNEWNNKFTFEDFLGDCTILLQDILKDFDRKRGISVIKMRGSKIDRSIKPYDITEKGIIVYPYSQII